MDQKKLLAVILTMAFVGATGVFYISYEKNQKEAELFEDSYNTTSIEENKKEQIEETQQITEQPESTPFEQKQKHEVDDVKLLQVYICGHVKTPGVYKVEEGTRVIEALELAGGFGKDASKEAVNLARKLQDGEQIYIPSKEEVKLGEYVVPSTEMVKQSDERDETTQEEGYGNIPTNLNTATKEELMKLPGIGEAKADRIISFREKNKFSKIEDVMNVDGIKQGVFDKIKDYITV